MTEEDSKKATGCAFGASGFAVDRVSVNKPETSEMQLLDTTTAIILNPLSRLGAPIMPNGGRYERPCENVKSGGII